jgi:hypothetical protein
MDLDVVLLDHHARPDPGHQFVLADDLSFCGGKDAKDVERPAAQRDRPAVASQLALAKVEAKPAKADLFLTHRIQPSRPPIQNN